MDNKSSTREGTSRKRRNWREKLGIPARDLPRISEEFPKGKGSEPKVTKEPRARLKGADVSRAGGESPAPGRVEARPAPMAPRHPVAKPAPLAPRKPAAAKAAKPAEAVKAPPRPLGPPRGGAKMAGGMSAPAFGKPPASPRPMTRPPVDDDFARRLRAQREAAEKLAARRLAESRGRSGQGAPMVTPPASGARPEPVHAPARPVPPAPAGAPAAFTEKGPAPAQPPSATPRTPAPVTPEPVHPAAPSGGQGGGALPFSFADTEPPARPAGEDKAARPHETATPAYIAPAPEAEPVPEPEAEPAPVAPAPGEAAVVDEELFEDEYATRRAAPEDYASAYDRYEEEFGAEPPRRKGMAWLVFLLAVLVMALVAVAVVYFFNRSNGAGVAPASGKVPVIQPQQTPVKVKPEAPAAKPAGHKRIYDRILNDGKEQGERVVPSEEKPLPVPRAPAGNPNDSGDALPLPLPPPPAMDGGQGKAPEVNRPTKSAQADAPVAMPAAAPPTGTTAKAGESGGLPPVPPPMSAQPPSGMGETVAKTDAKDSATASADSAGRRLMSVTTPRDAAGAADGKAAGTTRSKARAAVKTRRAKTVRARAARRVKRKTARTVARPAPRKVRQRQIARAPEAPTATPGPLSILPPPAAQSGGVRAYAPASPPAVAQAAPPAPTPQQAPRRVNNFNSGHKITNFTSAHAGRAASAAAQAPRRIAALPTPPARPASPAQGAVPRAQPPVAAARKAAPDAPAARAGTTAGKGYVVQLASYRSQADALREYQRIRGRHGRLLGGLTPRIQKKNLGAAGTFYRLGVGPLASRAQASKLCNALIASGERDCLVRRQ